MKNMILLSMLFVMAFLFVPAFSQRLVSNNASFEKLQGLVNAETGAVQEMNISQIRSQIQGIALNGTSARMIIQDMDVEASESLVKVKASMDNAQRIVMSAHMLRLNNEELFNGSSAIMAQINLAIRNKGAEVNLSIQSRNGEMNLTQEEKGIIVRVRNQELIMQNNSLFLNISNMAVELSVVPQEAMVSARIHNNSRADVELIVEGQIPKYQIREQKAVMILGLIPATMDVDSKVNALNGTLELQAKPWWSFLATE